MQLRYTLAHAKSASPDDVIYLMQSTTPSLGPFILPSGEEPDEFQLMLVLLVRDKYGSHGRSYLQVKVSSSRKQSVAGKISKYIVLRRNIGIQINILI